MMKLIRAVQCEGCGHIFRPEDLTADGMIGRHRWVPSSQPNLWDGRGFESRSEKECQQNIQRWNTDQQDYENRQNQAAQRGETNTEQVLERCRQDELLSRLVHTGDTKTASSRVDHLCEELGLEVDDLMPMGFEWDYFSPRFYQQCFAAAITSDGAR